MAIKSAETGMIFFNFFKIMYVIIKFIDLSFFLLHLNLYPILKLCFRVSSLEIDKFMAIKMLSARHVLERPYTRIYKVGLVLKEENFLVTFAEKSQKKLHHIFVL